MPMHLLAVKDFYFLNSEKMFDRFIVSKEKCIIIAIKTTTAFIASSV